MKHIHVSSGNRPCGWEAQHDANEEDPTHGHGIDWHPPSAQRKGSFDEANPLAVNIVRKNDRGVRQIQRRCRDAEDGRDGLRAADGDAVQHNAEDDDEPDGVERGACRCIDLAKEPA